MKQFAKITGGIDFVNTKSFKLYKKKDSQIDFYKKNNSSPEIMKLVLNESKAFGSLMENIVSEIFGLEKRINSQHDGLFGDKKIEIKSARYWANTFDCKWQHIEPDDDWGTIILVLVGFNDVSCWSFQKDNLLEMIENKIIKKQGKQGYWCEKSAIEKYLYPIKNKTDLENFFKITQV